MGERAARDADVVSCPTAAVAEELRAGSRCGRVEVVGEGVAAARRHRPAGRRRAGRAARAAGTVRARRRHPRAAEGARRRGRAPPAVPGLAGTSPLWWSGPAAGGSLTLPTGAGGRASPLGRLSDADLAVAYDRAAVVLVPSRCGGFGLPVLEAMTHGTPVVSQRRPRRWSRSAAGAAVPVPVGDADALADGVAEALATRRGARCRGPAAGRATFSWERAADSVLATSTHRLV